MSSATLDHQQLSKIGRSLVRWRAQLKLSWCLAAIFAVVCVLGLADLWLRLGQTGRLIAWGALVALVAFSIWTIVKALRKRFSDEGVAANLEKAFPELDNRLINFLQFSRDPGGDPFKEAYVKAGGPPSSGLDIRRLRDQEAHRRGLTFLAIAAALLVLPALFIGKAWGVTLWRTINPFSSVAPPSLTKIVSVDPGDTTALQGEPLVLSCTVKGFKGHEVQIEIDPKDGAQKTFALGRISTPDEESSFAHRIPKVTTQIRYRFRAGDAPTTDWFSVDTRIPPAFTSISVTVAPPTYTNRPTESLDLRSGEIPTIPDGSEISLSVRTNADLASCTLLTPGGQPVALAPTDGATSFSGSATFTSNASEDSVLRLDAIDPFGHPLVEEFGIRTEPDRGPAIEIVSPNGIAILPPGELPQIEFRVSDDYGLTEVRVEEVKTGPDGQPSATPHKRWASPGAPTFEQIWKSDLTPARGGDLTFRIVARDNRPGSPNETVSSPIVFNAPSHADAAAQRNELEEKGFAGLKKVIALQRENIAQTQSQQKAMEATPDDRWLETAARQEEVRTLTKELLANPAKPLGGLTDAVKDLYVREMVFATDALRSIPTTPAEQKFARATEALTMEKKILRQLSYAESAASQNTADRRVSGLAAMLEAMVRDQNSALEQTSAFAATQGSSVPPALVDAQDALAEDFTGFINVCRDESDAIRGNDAAFAETLTQIADKGESLRIREDMVVAAERLDENDPAAAAPLEERALTNLKDLQRSLESVKLTEEAKKTEAMLNALADAKENLGKIKDLHTEMLESMEDIRGATDKDTELVDYMEEAYTELLKNTKEALLEIPTDLHVFTDLNVANDVVEDVISVFEEIEQAGGDKENPSPSDVVEEAYAKEDIMLEMMEEAEGRIDDMEMWLGETADEIKVTTEAFDREEMPESGIATGALSTEVEDMIGDLLDEDEETNEAADDSATTHAMPDMEMGWEVMEGDISSFAAKGKSGNETPDHKEQDGRSNVGRQGMSTGETAAGSGTISEGDKNIEERRTEDPTQSGQVALEGEADTKATGGGKLGTGKADEQGMGGGAARMDSNEQGSDEGMASLMARQADALYAKASMKNIRVDSLKNAAHHLRQASDAIAKGDIEQMQEHRRLAVAALTRAKAELDAGPSGSLGSGSSAGALDDVIETGPDQAPPQFRDQVADYFKALNESL